MVFREQVNGLLRQEDLHSQSFEWLKCPRFYRKAQLDIRVAFIHQENLYGFNYL
jgi:IS5 family transposase